MDALWLWVATLTFNQQLLAAALFMVLIIAGVTVIVALVMKLLSSIAFFLKEADIKRVGLGGVEFYDDNTPKKRVPRKTVKKAVVK